jgi:hypothetical protein
MTDQLRKKGDSDYKFYSNIASVNYTTGEFYIRFARHDPKGETESIAVYMPAVRAKQLFKMLENQIKEYEKKIEKLQDLPFTKEPEKKKKETTRDVQYQ